VIGRKTLSGVVADNIIRQIREGEYEIGGRLPTLKELAANYDVGYGVAREAMQQLVALGLVDVRPRRGAIVRELDITGGLDDAKLAMLLTDHAVDELYDLRLLVEVAVAGQAASNATEKQLDGILTAQRAFDAEVRSGRPSHAADVDLHVSIALASGNTLFIRVLEALRGVLSEIRAQASVVSGASTVAIHEHNDVIQAIIKRDREGASEAMTKHIETAKATMHKARSSRERKFP